MKLNNEIMQEKMNRIFKKTYVKCDLCNFCTVENCDYLKRIQKSTEIMIREDLKIEDIIKDELGENPFKGHYTRWHITNGPICYCDKYQGALDKVDDFHREVVCLCGSTKFEEEFKAEQKRLTLEGKIVMSVGFFSHDEENSKEWENNGMKTMLDDLHVEKMMLSDRIHVINKDGYIGTSTKNQIEIAKKWGLPITYYEPLTEE